MTLARTQDWMTVAGPGYWLPVDGRWRDIVYPLPNGAFRGGRLMRLGVLVRS